MRVTITGRHMDVGEPLKAYIENGLQKVQRHFDQVSEAEVVLTVEKYRHIAEINLHANGLRVNSKESSPDMYASVDAVLEKLDKQIRRHKDRISRHKPRHSRETRNYGHNVIEFYHETRRKDEEDQDATHRLVSHEKLPMKPMSVEDAAMQLDLIDDAFLVFSNADTQQVNVIYSRDDGTYGVIEPQF